MTIRKADDRGHANHGWLDSHHTFSFADYHDPAQMGFRTLRVINEDRVQAAAGFPTHPHRDMEIVTYVLDGAIAHKDSMGNGTVINPGDVQRMSAGTGVVHSEFNASKTDPLHFFQIWVLPNKHGLAPSYEQKHFEPQDKSGRLRLVGSSDGRDGSVQIHQDLSFYASILQPKQEVSLELQKGRHAWVQVASGEVTINGSRLATGDGMAISPENSDEQRLRFRADQSSEFLVFDLA